MRVLVCGGREFPSSEAHGWLHKHALAELSRCFGRPVTRVSAVIHGDARGADRGGALWGADIGAEVIPFPVSKAEWTAFGKAAGILRNGQMLERGCPDVVVAFPGGTGTENMVARARRAEVPVILAR